MEVGKLTVTARTEFGKGAARKLRATGHVPGICYGPGVEQPLAIAVDPKALKQSLDPLKRRNTLIDVTVTSPRGNKTIKAMLRDFQIDFIKRVVTHVDLLAIDLNKEIEVEVPVRITGRAAGIIDGGQLHVERISVDVKCKPETIPGEFVVDVTSMMIGDVFHVSDLVYPEGVEPATPPKLPIVSLVAPKADKAEEEAAAAAAAEAAAAAPGAAPAAGDKKEEPKAGGEKKE